MIGKVIQVNKKCREEKVDLRVSDLNENLMEVFQLMKLDKILKIYPNESEAMEAWKGKKKGWFSS